MLIKIKLFSSHLQHTIIPTERPNFDIYTHDDSDVCKCFALTRYGLMYYCLTVKSVHPMLKLQIVAVPHTIF